MLGWVVWKVIIQVTDLESLLFEVSATAV